MPRNDDFSREFPPVFDLPPTDEFEIKSYNHNPLFLVIIQALGYKLENGTMTRSSNSQMRKLNVVITIDGVGESELMQLKCESGETTLNSQDGFCVTSRWKVVKR